MQARLVDDQRSCQNAIFIKLSVMLLPKFKLDTELLLVLSRILFVFKLQSINNSKRTNAPEGFLHNYKKKLSLTAKHKQAKFNYARCHFISGTDFRRWIFSDEVRFNLDGLNSFGSYSTKNVNLKQIKWAVVE